MIPPIKVGLVGVTGYTGMELARLIVNHPNFELACATSRSDAGLALKTLYPFLNGHSLGELIIEEPEPEVLAKKCKLVFLAVPHGTAMSMVVALQAKGVKVVDLSADFRIRDLQSYEEWYEVKHTAPDILSKAVYGLPEFYAEDIKKAQVIANPGCYPSSVILALYPALQGKLIKFEDIIIDAKSGSTGAGRGAKVGNLFCEISDNFKAYGTPKHRHIPEIEQELSKVAGQKLQVTFTPHLLPINRGILSTIYTKLQSALSLKEIHQKYCDFYAPHKFIRVLPLKTLPELRNVRGTMFCDLGFSLDERTGRLIIVSAIDNLCRGASGQALANANLMFGLSFDSGLNLAPLAP